MPLSSRLKSIGKRLAVAYAMESEEAVIGFIKSYVVGRLQRFGPEHLAGAIIADTPLWGSLPPKMQATIHKLAATTMVRKMFEKYSLMINGKTVLTWIEEQRPDLYSIFVNWPDARAMNWLNKNTEEFKTQFQQAMQQV